MKTVLIIFCIIIISIFISFMVLGKMSKTGKAPGLVKGALFKCSDKPNCVCSEQDRGDDHFIEPIIIPENLVIDTQQILNKIIIELGGKIQNDSGTYISAIFSSPVFGFVDDLEFRIDSKENVIHIRSASRVGYSDFDVNKKRAQLIQKLFYKRTGNE